MNPNEKYALVVGSTGITGGNLAARLAANGWQVGGLARKPKEMAGVTPIAADLQDATALHQSLAHVDPTHVFICTWLRQDSEAENVRVNGDMVRNLFAALEGKGLVHAALVTGTKHYLGPFESYGQTNAETPFREDNPRLPGLNFYYTQEDLLFEAAAKGGFGWTVHRSHTVIGYARGNAMNMGVTLAVYATLCRERGEPFVFPGSHEQWKRTDRRDRRAHPGRAIGMGGNYPPPHIVTLSTSPTATCFAGAGCGRNWRRTSAWSRRARRRHPPRWKPG